MEQCRNRMDQMYAKPERPWGAEPLPAIVTFSDRFKPGSVLDLGAGDDRNALYLAQKGFRVTGVDISEAAIQKLTKYADEAGIGAQVEGIAQDLTGFSIDTQYDNIICNYVLHFLPCERFGELLENMQAATATGGINVVSDFTQTGPMYEGRTTERWLRDGELQELYAG